MSHIARIVEALFPEIASYTKDDFARIGTDRPAVMFAMTARVGSTHLFDSLKAPLKVKNASVVGELFNCREVIPWYIKQRGLKTFEEVLQQFYSESGDYVVFKTSWLDFEYFKDHIKMLFPNLTIIYLDRLNVEAQAVSIVKAQETGVWHTSSNADLQKLQNMSQQVAGSFDLVKICGFIDALLTEKANWEKYFFDTGIEPVRLVYEGFSTNIDLAVKRVLKAIGADTSGLAPVKPNLKPLSDSVNDLWIKKTKYYRSGAFFEQMRAVMNRMEVLPDEQANIGATEPS